MTDGDGKGWMFGWGVTEFSAWIAWWVSGFWGFLVVALAILVLVAAAELRRLKWRR